MKTYIKKGNKRNTNAILNGDNIINILCSAINNNFSFT